MRAHRHAREVYKFVQMMLAPPEGLCGPRPQSERRYELYFNGIAH